MNVIPVWQLGITGKDVVVSILDDGMSCEMSRKLRFFPLSLNGSVNLCYFLPLLPLGIEHDHPDLQANYVSLTDR